MEHMENKLKIFLTSNFMLSIAVGINEYLFIIMALDVSNNDIPLVGFLYFIRSIPYLLCGPLSGYLSDEYRKRNIVAYSGFVRFSFTLALAFIAYLDGLDLFTLSLYGLLMGVCRALSGAAGSSIVKELADATYLKKANSVVVSSREIGLVVGPILGALIYASLESLSFILLINSLIYFLSALVLLALKNGESRRYSNGIFYNIAKFYHLEFVDFYKLSALKNDRVMFYIIVYSCICIMIVGGGLGILIPALSAELVNNKMVGFVMSSISAGTIFGSLLVGKIDINISVPKLYMCWMLYGLMLVFCLLLEGAASLVFWAFLLGMIGSTVDVIIPTLIQEHSDDLNVGRNFSYFSTFANLGDALSAILVSFVTYFLSTAVSITSLGLCVVAVCLVPLFAFSNQPRR